MKSILFLLGLTIILEADGQRSLLTQYKIGDVLPCGIVFHVRNIDTFGRQEVLICAKKDYSTKVQWAPVPAIRTSFRKLSIIRTFASANQLFDKTNTNKIIRAQGAGIYAARVARFFVDSCADSTEWYLPSVQELKLMYERVRDLGNFNTQGYWSSVEILDPASTSYTLACIVNFNPHSKSGGKSIPVGKHNSYYVRAVRSFKN